MAKSTIKAPSGSKTSFSNRKRSRTPRKRSFLGKNNRSKIGRKMERVKRSSRGCSRQSGKKYSSRKSPPFPANNCCGSVKKGNDGKTYRSKRASNGICRWVKS